MPITIVAASASSVGSDTPAEPTGAAANDVLFAIATDETTTATWSPSGEWNLIRRDSGLWTDNFQVNTYWCRRGSSAPSYDLGISSSSGLEQVGVIALRGVKASGTPYSVTPTFNNANTTSYVFTGLTPATTDNFLLGLLGIVFAGSGVNHQPGAPHFEGESLDNSYVHIMYGIAGTTSSGIYAPTSATGNINASGDFYWGATLIAVEPDNPIPHVSISSRRRQLRPAPFRPGIAR